MTASGQTLVCEGWLRVGRSPASTICGKEYSTQARLRYRGAELVHM